MIFWEGVSSVSMASSSRGLEAARWPMPVALQPAGSAEKLLWLLAHSSSRLPPAAAMPSSCQVLSGGPLPAACEGCRPQLRACPTSGARLHAPPAYFIPVLIPLCVHRPGRKCLPCKGLGCIIAPPWQILQYICHRHQSEMD